MKHEEITGLNGRQRDDEGRPPFRKGGLAAKLTGGIPPLPLHSYFFTLH